MVTVRVTFSEEAEAQLDELSGRRQAEIVLELQWVGFRSPGRTGPLHLAGMCLQHVWKDGGRTLHIESLSPCCLCSGSSSGGSSP